MSQRVHSNIGWALTRRLAHVYGTADKAIGTSDPNTLHSNLPTKADAMGRAAKSGLVTFAHSGNAQAFTIYYWSELVNKLTAAQGWVRLGAGSAEYTKTVDAYAAGSFTIPEDSLFFIQAGTSTCTDCWTGGAFHYEGNPNKDLD